MKLVRYDRNGAVRVAALDGEHVVDLLDACPVGTPTAHIAALSDMTRLIAAGEAGLETARTALAGAQKSGAGRVPLARVKLKAPVVPTLILCSGENYWDHRDEKPEVARKDPEFFLKTGLGVIGPEDEILRDERITKKLDYETELLIVVGQPGRHVPRASALEHVFGYSIMNDVTARDRQVTLRPAHRILFDVHHVEARRGDFHRHSRRHRMGHRSRARRQEAHAPGRGRAQGLFAGRRRGGMRDRENRPAAQPCHLGVAAKRPQAARSTVESKK